MSDSQLTPDLAGKVLTADVRNQIKKVSDGGTLGSTARTHFQTAVLLPTVAHQARATSLFKRWAAGGRLNADELAELHAWTAAQPTEASAAIEEATSPAAASSPALILDAVDSVGPRIIGSRVKYPESLSVYAQLYETDERTVKRYVKRGRDCAPPDLPPLHRPGEMPSWWARRMQHRCPTSILQAAAKATAEADHSAPAPALAAAAQIPAPAPTMAAASGPSAPAAPRSFTNIQTLDLPANVEQLRRSLAIIEQRLEEARAGVVVDGQLVIDDGVISSRQRDYRDTFTELRKAENDLIAWQEQRGELVPRDEVRAENNRIAAAIYRAVLQLLKTVRPQLAGKPDSEQERIWNTEVVGCFAGLKTAKFTSLDPATA